MRHRINVYNYGLTPYKQALQMQSDIVSEKIRNHLTSDVLMMLEHFPVYTLGRGASIQHVHFDMNDTSFEIHRVERGGQVTYHCPGQLVAYPILNLKNNPFKQDLHWYLRQLEETVISMLSKYYGIQAERDAKYTGVWVGNQKICAIGLTSRKWITFHGIGLNVNCDLSGFDKITPCGIDESSRGVTSISKLLGRSDVSMSKARYLFLKEFLRVFEVDCVHFEDGASPTAQMTTDLNYLQHTNSEDGFGENL